MADPAPRRRMAPDARRDHILDAAARLILAEGVSAASMEQLGRAAGVSKALVYAYFPGPVELLATLLEREQRAFRATGRRLLEQAKDFESAVRLTTAAYLDHVATRGLLIERLLNEPGIAGIMADAERADRRATTDFFGRAITRKYGMDPRRAALAADMLMGLTGAAGLRLRRMGEDRELLLELAISLILASLAGITRRPS